MTDRTKEDVVLALTDAILSGYQLYWESWGQGETGGVAAKLRPDEGVFESQALFTWRGSKAITKNHPITLDEAKKMVDKYWSKRI